MVNRYMQRCSTSLIREMQMKTTIKNHSHLSEKLSSVNQRTSVGKGVEKGDPHALLVVLEMGASAMENSMEIPQKFKTGIAL